MRSGRLRGLLSDGQVFLLFRASTSRKGFAVAMALGWLVGFAVLAAESSEAPGTVDLLFGAVWCVGAAASGVLGCAGAGYLVRLAGIRRPDWYLEPLLAAILAAPGAVALLSVVPVFV